VLFEGDDPAILFRVERDFILEFNCIAPLGFNMTGGGDGVWNPSQETRQKMRESARRRPPPSEATREKRRQSQKASGRRPPPPVVGHSVSEESRRKISAALKGHPVSEETIEKIRKTQQARKEAGYVRKKRKPATAETRAKISAQRKGKTYEEIYGPEKAREKRLAITKKMIGRVITEEHRRRISETKQRKKNAS
jgi:MoxR-like ATPase